MDANEEKYFKNEILKKCLKGAIETLQRDDADLIESACSERAQVHWLAIYFQKELENEGYSFENKKGYRIDVEYNRFGLKVGTSKQLVCICVGCTYKTICSKWKIGHSSAITIDMVLHHRGKNELNDNILCVEIKPKHVSKTSCNVECDKWRIKELCSASNTLHQPHYQYGLALHIISSEKYEGFWYHNGIDTTF